MHTTGWILHSSLLDATVGRPEQQACSACADARQEAVRCSCESTAGSMPVPT